MSGTVLLVDDDKLHRRMLATLLERKLDYASIEASDGREALSLLEQDERRTIRLVILDLSMPVMGGLETLAVISERWPGLPVIMLTGNRDIEKAVAAMKAGATDFLNKPYEAERMAVTVRNALRIGTLTREVSRLKRKESGEVVFEDLTGHDGGLAGSVAMGRKAAASAIPVLVTGETGTGKELFARAIHGESDRAGKPFIALNCGAIPPQLVESTLFGHEKGSFTGATERAPGKFREADGGTIFLDEVGELPPEAQVKLLRVLQQKEVEPVGAARPVPVDVRVISATNRDLASEVRAGSFREDLYFRLNVLEIRLPPLRERAADIPVLARHFIERFAAGEKRPPPELDPAMEKILAARRWPGNVRELENAVYRAVVLGGGTLEAADFGAGEEEGRESAQPQMSGSGISVVGEDGGLKPLEQIEREAMDMALRHHGDNITEAARALGIAKSTFYRRMKSGE